MISAEDCKAFVSECLHLRNCADVTPRRVAALMAMVTSLVILANQIQRYETVLAEEAGERAESSEGRKNG
jgi:hypothetical protein